MRPLLLAALVFAFPIVASAADEPTTAGATVTLRDVSIAELVDKLEYKLGYKVAGKVTVVANLSIPLNEAGAAKDLVLVGKLTAAELSLDDLKVRDVTAEMRYAEGKLTLSKLTATVPSDLAGEPAGRISGTAAVAVQPRGDLSAKLTLTKLPLGILFKTLPGGIEVAGAVSGQAEFRAPVDTVSDPANWTGGATLAAPALTAFGRTIRDVDLKVTLAGGVATLKSLSGTAEGVPVTGDGSLTLSGKYPFTAALRTAPKDVSEIQKLVPELDSPVPIRGKLAIDATASGDLSPFAVTASGGITATDLVVGGAKGEKLVVKWKLTRERLTVTDVTAGVFGGSISGHAEVPLKATEKGDFSLKFEKIDAAAVVATFPKMPVRVAGVVSGGLTGTMPVAVGDKPRAITAAVNLTAPRLTVQGVPANDLTGEVSVEGTALRYALVGKTLGGSFEVKGRYPEAKAKPKEEDEEEDADAEEADPNDGSITLRGIDLSRLAEALRWSGTRLRGTVDVTFRHSADFEHGDGRYRVRDLALNGTRLVSDLNGRVRVRNGRLELTDAVGPLADGSLRARVRASLSAPERNSYRLDIDRADLGRLLAGFGPRAGLIEGGASLTVRGRIWPRFTATGTLAIPHGRLAGLTASDLRVPFQLGTTAGGGFQLTIRDLAGQIGGGRVAGQFEYAGGAAGRVSGQLRFTGVRIGNVLTDFRQSNYFGNARVTGRIDVSGENVTSADDLRGSLVATVEQAAVRDLPVLSAVTPFVSPTALVQPFDAGELRGRLARGVFRLERLTLSSPNADLYADGTVSLGGRLDLGVIVRTGTVGLNDTALRQLGLTLPLTFGPLPIALIRDASIYLSNRTVRLSVTGTTARPQPKVNAAALFSEEAIRFFLRRYFPLAADILPEVTPKQNR